MPDEAALEYKTQVIENAVNAGAGAPPLSPGAACQACHRVDLQLLIVTPSVVPKVHAGALGAAGYAWAPAFDAEFTGVQREATVPVARIARTGYFMLYYPQRDRWDVWQVMENGLTRKLMHQVNNAQYAKMQSQSVNVTEPKQCSRGAANLPAHLISVSGAKAVDKLWLAYTPRLWSPVVLKQFADNPSVDVPGADGKPGPKKKLREMRGRELQPSSIVKGSAPGAACLPLDVDVLEHHVVDFVKQGSPAFKRAFELALRPLDGVRFGQAGAFEQAVRAAEKADHPTLYVNKSLIVMLPDDEGVIEQHNHLRLCAKEAQQAWAAGGPDFNDKNDDPLRSWKLRSALHVEMIENWVYAEKLARQKEMMEAGAYRDGLTITDFELKKIREQERSTGKSYYPAGTTIEPNGSVPPTYRVTLPESHVQEGLAGVARGQSKGRIERYRGKLKMAELEKFRGDFKAGTQSWEAYIARLDADYVTWLKTSRLATTLNYDFDTKINLARLDTAHGTVLQQVEDVIARHQAIEKAWGGGAVSPASERELAKAYGKDPEAPATWINSALLEPWALGKAIADDKGKQKDVAEKINGVAREMPNLVKEALHARHEIHARHVESLLLVQQQAAQLQAVLLDPPKAKQIGAVVTTAEEVMRCFTVQVRTAAVMNIVLNPAAERYVTVAVSLPTGETLDQVGNAIRGGKLEMQLESKEGSTRQTRRQSRNALRKLAAQKNLQKPELQSLILSESKLQELAKQAARQGEAMVEVVAEGTLGDLPHAFKLPRSTALKLVAEQASFAKASLQALRSRQAGVVGVIGIFQIRSLLEALDKLHDLDGYAYADTLMTVMGSTAGLLEGGFGLAAAVFEIKASGSKVVLASRVTAASSLRLIGGVFGASSSGFDAVASYAKYRSRLERGDIGASNSYLVGTGLFAISGASLLGGTIISFANSTVARFALSRAIVTRIGGAAVVELIGSSLTGVGIVLGLLGFAATLYAESLEDDLNEIFLKRSYWGDGDRSEAKYAAGNQPKGNADAQALLNWAEQGLKEEADSFGALSVGFKSSLEWQSNLISSNVVQARVETSSSNEKRRVAYELVLTTPASCISSSAEDAKMELDKESGRYVLDIKLSLESKALQAAHTARFTYNVYEEFERASIARDILEVKRG